MNQWSRFLTRALSQSDPGNLILPKSGSASAAGAALCWGTVHQILLPSSSHEGGETHEDMAGKIHIRLDTSLESKRANTWEKVGIKKRKHLIEKKLKFQLSQQPSIYSDVHKIKQILFIFLEKNLTSKHVQLSRYTIMKVKTFNSNVCIQTNHAWPRSWITRTMNVKNSWRILIKISYLEKCCAVNLPIGTTTIFIPIYGLPIPHTNLVTRESNRTTWVSHGPFHHQADGWFGQAITK